MDPELLQRALEELAELARPAKAVVAVDIYGQCADYDAIQDVCNTYHVPLIEDAAEALGARYKGRPAGTFGAFGCFSFNGNKIITTSGDGRILPITERRSGSCPVSRSCPSPITRSPPAG